MAHAIADQSTLLAPRNTALPAGKGRVIALALIALGAVAIALAIVGALFTGGEVMRHIALASYHAGFLFTLGSTIFVMILHQVNAGWSSTIRRQLENVMSLNWLCLILFIPIAILAPMLFHWMHTEAVQGDVIYQAKAAYLNKPFFYARAVIYFALWTIFTQRLYRLSIGQDTDGDRHRSFKARRMSSYGLIVMALTTAFAAFDWIMSLDYHWFSTMFGVYFFAGFAGAALSLCALLLIMLRRTGALAGLVTQEHLHDLGKLMFGFVVFWAYIGFSQYFLIWYANIPEETGWFFRRRSEAWYDWSVALAAGRFVVPFIILMPRPWRRSPRVLIFITLWILAFHVIDLFWVVRPEIYGPDDAAVTPGWIDAVGVAGPLGLYLGLLVRRIVSAPLIPLKDPRLPEALRHENYV